VVNRLAHELDVIERVGLAEFFLICWDLMRFAKEQGIPAQGRGSATSSIVSYTLGISRVEPIAHNLLFERFINEGRTTYPDVDIDFSSERREEVIQYVYRRYGPEHTGMVCNLVTYRARSAVREVGYALGFPRPLVDRVAKALETYDSVMVRRDLEADGGFAEFFRQPGEDLPAEAAAADAAAALGFVDGMGQLNTRVPLVGKVPPWRQPPKPDDPAVPRPFAWLGEVPLGADAGAMAGSAGVSEPVSPAEFRQIPTTRAFGAAAGGPGDDSAAATPKTIPPQAWDGSVSMPAASAAVAESPPDSPNAPHTGIWQESRRGTASSGASVGPSRSGMWEEAPESPPSIRPGGRTDDEGGPGDTPASVAWLRAGRGTGYSPRRAWSMGDRSIRRVEPWHHRRGMSTGWAGPTTGTPRAHPGPRSTTSVAASASTGWGGRIHIAARWRESSRKPRPRPAAAPRSACPTGTAGSSSAPGSMASRATSPSTPAACSSPPLR
jgi:hypothetical protein